MNKAVDFLKKADTFFLATVDGDRAAVRPFGAVIEFEGRAYFCTNNTKPVFKQLVKNPKVEISAMGENRAWLRLTGEAVVDGGEAARSAMLEANPGLRNMYKLDDGIFEVFYLKNAKGTIFSGQNSETFDA